jgi:hypothetical protein
MLNEDDLLEYPFCVNLPGSIMATEGWCEATEIHGLVGRCALLYDFLCCCKCFMH